MDSNTQKENKGENGDSREEMAKLKAENRRLQKEQDILFLLMDLGMSVVELWGEKNGLLGSKENIDKDSSDWNNQIGVLLDQIREPGKDSRMDRLAVFLNFLQSAK